MKKSLKILAVLVALIIMAAFALPMFISADYLKGQLVAQVKQATGRTLDIKGKASLKLFPNIAVSVQDATLGNPEGFASPYFVHVDTFETGAALMPLFSKRLEITGMTLDGAVLHLEQNAAGAKNWAFASGKSVAPKPEAAPAAPAKASPLRGFALGDVALKNSSVTFAKAGAKTIALNDIDVTVSGADGSTPLKIDGSTKFNNETVKLKLALEQSKAFLAGKTSPIELTAELPATTMSFKGTASQTMQAEGTLDMRIGDTGKLTSWATGKPVAGLPKKIALKSGLDVQNDKAFALKDATITADALSADASLAVDLANAVPALKGTIKIAELNTDSLGKGKAVPAANGSTSATAAKSDGWSDAPLDAGALRAVNADVTVTIGKVTSGKLELSDIAANLASRNGVAKLVLSHLSLYGGGAKGSVMVDGSRSGVGITADLALSGVEIEPLMTALTGASRVKGTANWSLNASGRGNSQRGLIFSLNGSGDMKIADGAINGINIASFLRDAKKGFILADSSTEGTDFTALTGSYKIAQGVVSNDDLAMQSPVLRLSGKGTVNLAGRTIDYRAVPTIVGTLKGQGGKADAKGLEIPLIIRGPWNAVSVTPDVAGMIQEGLKNPEALKQNLKDLKGGIGNYNSPKDIGRALFGGKQAEQPAAATPEAQKPAEPVPVAPATAPQETAPASDAAPAKKQKVKFGDLLKDLGK